MTGIPTEAPTQGEERPRARLPRIPGADAIRFRFFSSAKHAPRARRPTDAVLLLFSLFVASVSELVRNADPTLARSFEALLAVPSSAARIAMNVRFFQRSGMTAATALAVRAIDSLAGFVVQIVLLVAIAAFGLIAFETPVAGSTSFTPARHRGGLPGDHVLPASPVGRGGHA